jgi:hypothetical protein
MLDTAQLIERLESIEHDLATRQNVLGDAAEKWYRAKREKERLRAVAFLEAEGTVAERQAVADRETALYGQQEEAEYEAVKAVVRVLETRASIDQTLTRTHARTA